MPPRKRSRRRLPVGRRPLRWLLLGGGVALLAWMATLVWPFWQLSKQLGDRPVVVPSRLYGRPFRLALEVPLSRPTMLAELKELGYRNSSSAFPQPGQYQAGANRYLVHLRRSPTPQGWREPGVLEVEVSDGLIVSLGWRGKPARAVDLEPPLIASYYGAGRSEHRPARLEDLPEHLVKAVLAAEDARFFHHGGLSLRGIARALWVDLRGGELRQGGSTLTQQLVKNLYLSQERTLGRKLREIPLALLVDWRYSKPAILSAYLNEIYWGLSGSVNLMGVGAASWAYFGKEPDQVDLCESALLAGLIRSPGGYSPERYPERALERRNWVLGRMVDEGWLDESTAAAERKRPLCYSPHPLTARAAPYFADAMAQEAATRFGLGRLEESGAVLLSDLEVGDQRAAEEAVSWGVSALEEGWEKERAARHDLQAALVSLDPRDGSILAYVGGRDYGQSQFDRVSAAHRQAGSAFKPVVYATAFEHRVASPTTALLDEPLTVALASSTWRPQNSDGKYRGWVTARRALEDSLNVPTARLALETGLEQVVDMAHALGVSDRLRPFPALALGAFEVSPRELANVYATLAGGGVWHDIHGLEAVLDRDGRPLAGHAPEAPRRALSEQTAYLVTSLLQGVLERGTGEAARRMGVVDPLAGKTGTTNGRRDSWFVGYSPDRVTLVWVGYDDNTETRLSGARAALPIWGRFTWRVRPPGGYPLFRQPRGVTTATVDPETGGLATDRCPTVFTEVFLADQVPTDVCPLHGGWFHRRSSPRQVYRLEEESRFARWLRRVFDRSRDEQGTEAEDDEPPPEPRR